jgi:hypothetical protein
MGNRKLRARPRARRTRAAAALAAVGALVMTSGVVLLSAPAASAGPDKVHKSYVCKYVSVPGEAERLQEGDNPIWVDNHSIPGYDGGPVEDGDVFVDRHVKSIVIKANTLKLDPEPGVESCPGGGEPGPETVPYQGITENDPCGRENDSLTIPTSPDTNGVTYVPTYNGASWSVLITAPQGKTLQGEDGRSTKTVRGSFSNEPCGDDKKVVVCKYTGTPPGTPSHIIVVSTSALGQDWDGVTFPWAFGDAQDSIAIRYAVGNEQPGDEELANCPELRETKIPAGITTNDPCGPNNVTWAAKQDAFFDYTEANGVVTATLKEPGKYLVSGQTSWTLADYEKNVPCPDTPLTPPGAPDVLDPCNPPGVTSNNSFVLPTDTATLDWEPGPNGSVTVAPQDGYTFSGPSQLITFDLPADAGEACVEGVEEIAPAVSFQDPTCDLPNRTTWSGTFTDIVDYTVSGTPGRGESITVTAAIKPGMEDQYAFVAGADTSFDHTYPTLKSLNCVKGSETAKPKPDKTPTVLGTQAGVPTAVAAGLGDTAGPASSTTSLLGQLLVAGGMLLLMAGGWIGLGRRESGAHAA